jgi:hypothetical protein
MSATVQLLLTETLYLTNLRTADIASRLAFPSSAPQRQAKLRSAVFATLPRRQRLSSMASESLNSSHEDVHGRHQRPVENNPERISRSPYATQAATGAAAARAFFPLGYREGFSQWVSYNRGTHIAEFR